MRTLLFPLFVLALLPLNARGGEVIPDSWKDFPDFRFTYVLKKDVPAEDGLKGIPKGTRVSLSLRQLDLLLDRGELQSPTLALLINGGENEDDPGVYDATIPFHEFGEFLAFTTEPRPLTHWQSYYKEQSHNGRHILKSNHYQYNNFPVTVFPAAPYQGERPRLMASGLMVQIIKSSPYCLESEVTLALSEQASSVEYLNALRKRSPLVPLAGPWYGKRYCVDRNDFLYGFRNGPSIEE